MLEMLAQLYVMDLPLPKSVPFTRFLVYLEQVDSEKAKMFWNKQLEEANMTLFPALPYYSYRLRVRGRIIRRMNGRQRAGLETISTVLRAAWAMVAAQYSGVDDTVLLVATSGRSAPVSKTVDLMAPTITTVPVHVHISHQQTVHGFLKAMQQQATEMIPFEHTGIQNIRRLVPKLGTRLDPGHLFIVQAQLECEGKGLSGMDVLEGREALEALEDFDDYPLSIQCTTSPDNSTFEIEARFDDKVIPRTNAADTGPF